MKLSESSKVKPQATENTQIMENTTTEDTTPEEKPREGEKTVSEVDWSKAREEYRKENKINSIYEKLPPYLATFENFVKHTQGNNAIDETVKDDTTDDNDKHNSDGRGDGELPDTSKLRPREDRESDSGTDEQGTDKRPSDDKSGTRLVGSGSVEKTGKRGRATINQKIVALLEEKKYSTDRSDYTNE